MTRSICSRARSLIAVTLITLLTAYLLGACLAKLPRYEEVSAQQSAYSFDPVTVRHALSTNETNIFRLEWSRNLELVISGTFMTPLPVPKAAERFPPSTWSENDFLGVADAFAQLNQHVGANRETLYSLTFRVPCETFQSGPQSATLGFFHESLSDDIPWYQIASIDLDLRTGLLKYTERIYRTIQQAEGSLHLGLNHLSFDQALVTADTNGGSQFRQKEQNRCLITGWRKAKVNDDSWSIEYDANASQLKFGVGRSGIGINVTPIGP